MQLELLDKLRAQNPVIFNIANFVTVQDVANAVNAIGASPIMSNEIAEAEEIVRLASAVTVNIGCLTKQQIIHIKKVEDLARQYNKPIVFDPVAVGAVEYRYKIADKLLWDFHTSIIRGNIGEIAALGGFDWSSKGIDAGSGSGDIDEITAKTAQKYHCTVIASGPTDTISDGKRIAHIHNGSPLFKTHVGSGDMLTSIVTAFTAVTDDPFEAAQIGALVFSCAGQLVVQDHPNVGPATFGMYLMDYLYKVKVADIEQIADFD